MPLSPRFLWITFSLLTTLVGCRRESTGDTLRLGYFPNLTHAQALVGVKDGTFSRALEGRLKLNPFNAGPAAVEALLGGSLDVAYIGSSPAVIAYVRSDKNVRVIATAVSGGSVLVTRTARTPAELKGKRIATPQLGNSQDVALRHWLQSHGLSTSDFGKGDVTVVPVTNADALGLLQRGELEGAWVPEPWGAKMVEATGAQILVDERTLWPSGRFPTTLLLASTEALQKRRPQLKALIKAHVQLTERWKASPERFMNEANQAFGALTKHPLPDAVLQAAFSRMEPWVRPLPEALARVAKNLKDLKYLPEADVTGMVDGSLLEELMLERSQASPGG